MWTGKVWNLPPFLGQFVALQGLVPGQPPLQDFFDRARPALWPRILIMERTPGPAHDQLMARLAECGYREVLASPLNVALMREATPAG